MVVILDAVRRGKSVWKLRSPSGGVRVLLAENRVLLRIGVHDVLSRMTGITVLGEVGDIAGAVSEIERQAPEVVLVGMLVDCVEPEEATRKVAMSCQAPAPRLLTLAGTRDTARPGAPLDVTAGILPIDTRPEHLTAAVFMASEGWSFFNDSAGMAPERPLTAEPRGPLTRREQDVLLLLAKGHTNAEISAQLVLTESTVKTHVQNLLRKLRLRRRIDAVVYAYEHGLVQVGGDRADLPTRAGVGARVQP